MLETPSVTQLAQVISHAIAPAFILGAVSGFISVLVARLNRIVDRCRSVHRAGKLQEEPLIPFDLARLNARAALINKALMWALASALATVVLMIVAFVHAFFELPHERGVAILFVVALSCLAVSLVNFAREVRIVINDPSNFD